MRIRSITKITMVILLAACVVSVTKGEKTDGKKPLKVFVLAGQSNMQGKGTIKHLDQVVDEHPEVYGDLKCEGKWIERNDVWIDYLNSRGRKKGKLTVGYGSPEDRIGPELGFGNAVGDALEEPVLIIKYAVGGCAIGLEFRPPSSGPIDPCTIPAKLQEQIDTHEKKPGGEYHKMMSHIMSVMGNIHESAQDYDDGPVELAGFVWFQGWNDQYNGNAETFLLIGNAFARAILEMQPAAPENAKSRLHLASQEVEAIRFDPVVRQIEGWTVHVDPSMLEGEHSETGARALKILANHLQRIAILLPEEQLAKMRKLEIWIEHHHPTLAAMQYHPSLDWLKSHGHDPRLARKVHIPRAASLFARHQMIKHPAVVLHELAHAYHDQYLGFDNPRIIKAYENAEASGRYEKVLLYNGTTARHYGLNNHKEYFAEGTEAYFYRNDFYPFCRAELEQHDPTLHDLLVEVWGPLR